MDGRTSTAKGAIDPLRPENQQLLNFLDELMATDDDTGAEWWDEFRASLHANPLRLGPPRAE